MVSPSGSPAPSLLETTTLTMKTCGRCTAAAIPSSIYKIELPSPCKLGADVRSLVIYRPGSTGSDVRRRCEGRDCGDQRFGQDGPGRLRWRTVGLRRGD